MSQYTSCLYNNCWSITRLENKPTNVVLGESSTKLK